MIKRKRASLLSLFYILFILLVWDRFSVPISIPFFGSCISSFVSIFFYLFYVDRAYSGCE